MHHVLDDPGFVTRLDPKGIYGLAADFPNQCRRALDIAQAASLPDLSDRPRLAVLTGMGGSAAGGDLIRALFEANGAVPFLVNRDYTLPNCVGLGDLVFCASYSGNTEETLSAYDVARRDGARIVAITSGGELAAKATADGQGVIEIPGGQPPRTALGYMFIPVLVACEGFGLLPAQNYASAFGILDKCLSSWGSDVPMAQNPAKQIAASIHGKLTMLYGLGSYQAIVANRWKGQINENAKNMAFANGFPELNHNEILGWMRASQQGVSFCAGIVLEDGTESEKMKARDRVTEEIIGPSTPFHHVQALGENLLERMLSLVYFGDFLSLYLAALNGVDPENIDSINFLKSELTKVD